jgi:hypothetical protein
LKWPIAWQLIKDIALTGTGLAIMAILGLARAAAHLPLWQDRRRPAA